MTKRLAARVTSDPKIKMGKPVLEGTRIPVEFILRGLGAGDSEQQILPDCPRLTTEAVRAVNIKKWPTNYTIQLIPTNRFRHGKESTFCLSDHRLNPHFSSE